MSLELKYDIYMNGFWKALKECDEHKGFYLQFEMDLSDFISEYHEKSLIYEKKRLEIMTRHCKKDEDGNPAMKKKMVMNDDGVGKDQDVYDFSPEASDLMNKDMNDLAGCDVIFNSNPIKLDLSKVTSLPDRVFIREIKDKILEMV